MEEKITEKSEKIPYKIVGIDLAATDTTPTEPRREDLGIPTGAPDGTYKVYFGDEVVEVEVRNPAEYIPTEYAIIDWERSWKKCRCGRITGFRDLWCPSCGQRLGRPDID